MSALEKYLNVPNPGPAAIQSLGTESDWLEFTHLELSGSQAFICDYSFLPNQEDGLLVNLPPGKYEVTAKVIDYSGDRRISRLRVTSPGSSTSLGNRLGETWTDTACTAVCDLRSVRSAFETLGDSDAQACLEKASYGFVPCGICSLTPETRGALCFASSGFGDGTYPVFELVSSGQRVGFEIEFIGRETKYPFGDEEAHPVGGSESSEPTTAPTDPLAGLMAAARTAMAAAPAKDKESIHDILNEQLESIQRNAESALEELRALRTKNRRRQMPMTVRYLPIASPPSLPAGVSETLAELVGLGFKPVGIFEISPLPNFRCWGLVHPAEQIAAQILPTQERLVIELGVRLSGDQEFRGSNADAKPGIPNPPWVRTMHLPEASSVALVEAFRKALPSEAKLPLPVGDFGAVQTQSFERTQRWRMERGGWSLEELKAQRKLSPQAPVTEELQAQRHDAAELWFWHWLRAQPTLPFDLDRVVESLTLIHDDLSPDLALNAWRLATRDLRAKVSRFEACSAREAFAQLNAESGCPIERVLQKTTPLEVDFYLPASKR